MGVGVILRKTHVLSSDAPKVMASLLTSLTMPLMSFTSMVASLNRSNIASLGMLMVILFANALILHILSGLFTKALKLPPESAAVHKFTFVQPNTAFVGVAVITALWAEDAGIFIGAIQLSTSLYVNTLGIYTLGSGKAKMSPLDLIKTPMFWGCIGGVVFALLEIPIPEPLFKVLQNIGNMTTPLAMIYTGCLICEMNLLQSLRRRSVIMTTIARLVVIPLFTFLILRPIFADQYFLYAVPTVMAAMPSFTLLPVFAGKYGVDVGEAAALVAATTTCSLLTIPLITLLLV